ncbi:unnamed protein product, partial [marine sediment metagenome]
MEAHGAFGKVLTYQDGPAGPKVYPYTVPKDPKSADQLTHRSHYLDGARLWKFLSAAERLAWKQTHQAAGVSPYNIWLQTLVRRETQDHDWQHPLFFDKSHVLGSYVFILPFELRDGGNVYDVSGHKRHCPYTDVDWTEGARGHAITLDADSRSTRVTASASLGDKTALSAGLVFRSPLAHASHPVNRIIT